MLRYNHTCSFAQMWLLIGTVSQMRDVAYGPFVIIVVFQDFKLSMSSTCNFYLALLRQ